jgi:hypothetical protein
MLTFDLKQFMFELKDGAIKHVGASNNSATVKLYDVEGVEVREFGDERVKLTFEDADDNEVEVALDPPEAREVARGIEMLEDESNIFE